MGRGMKPHSTKVTAPTISGAPGVSAVSSSSKPQKVIGFYSDKDGKPWREFSNFYRHSRPYEFVLPACARREAFPGSVWCHFAEKAIMATKAAMMGDREIFEEISRALDPKSCKALGRGVRNFRQELWDEHLEEIAFEVVKQKFSAEKGLRELLLSTGDAILAEAAPNDSIWGIGLSSSDERVKDPSAWLGRNVLGYALMRARDHLSGGTAAISSASSARTSSAADADRTPADRKASSFAMASSSAAGSTGSGLAVAEGEPEGGALLASSANGAAQALTIAPTEVQAAKQRRWAPGAPLSAFDAFAVLDFEATCDEPRQPQPQEIIELPMVLVDARSGMAVAEFRTYVRPVRHPRLTHFCTELTGIQQSDVDGAPAWHEALTQAQEWLEAELRDRRWSDCVFVTCGDWDLNKMMPQQCATSGMHIPQGFRRWINIKQVFFKATGRKGSGMPSMLQELKMPLQGRHHSGLDDCRNIARILARLLELGGPLSEADLSEGPVSAGAPARRRG